MTPEQRTIARNAKALRIWRDCSKVLLGHRCWPQLDAATIAKVENPPSPLWNASDETLQRLAHGLGVSARVLRGEAPLPKGLRRALSGAAARDPDPGVRACHRVLCNLLPKETAVHA